MSCSQSPAFTAKVVDPDFVAVSETCLDYTCLDKTFSPLPKADGAMCTSTIDSAPNDFFAPVSGKGAFKDSSDNWLAGWSKVTFASTVLNCTDGDIIPAGGAGVAAHAAGVQ